MQVIINIVALANIVFYTVVYFKVEKSYESWRNNLISHINVKQNVIPQWVLKSPGIEISGEQVTAFSAIVTQIKSVATQSL